MLSTERTEFEALLAKLCAGFNVPNTPDRIDAYWDSLAKMSLLQFARVVEFALGPDSGLKKIPVAPGVWDLYRSMRTQNTTITQAPAQRRTNEDHLLFLANRMFLRHVTNRGGLKSEPELLAARKVVRDVVAWFEGQVRDGDADATPAEFIEQLTLGLSKVSPPAKATLEAWAEMAALPDAKKPFPKFMGRYLDVASQQALVA